ncbi:MAG: Heavy metal RND efflux outer membrane protein, CzcC family [Rhodanobacteraceae bacterium]|jgi:outer membrane protein TolC|nr:MAG: Heavy metal RND efflux outer membrane protein, CzcC family [Rhodanobacteraceae bacterium]
MHSPSLWRRVRAPRLLVAILFALAALPLHAASKDTPLSLDAATQLAAARAPQVQAQLLRAQAARHDAVRAGRLPDPQLTAGINNLTATGSQAFNAAADSMTMRSIGVMQEIPSYAKREAEKAVANSSVQLSAADVLTVRLAVKQATAGAWVRLWAAQTERKQLQDLHEQFALAVQLAKARLRGGTGSATDVLAARAAVVELDNRITGVDAEIASARAALQRWLGNDADATLGAAPDFSTLPAAPAQLLHDLDRQGPLLGWAAREDQAQAKLDLAKAGKRPNWSVGLVYGSRIHLPDMIGIEVGVSLPLFPGDRQDQDISARYAERDAVKDEHEDARRAQREAVAAGLAEWQGDGKQVSTYRDKLLPLATDRSRTALAAYRGGGSLQPWLEARRDEINTRVAYAQALAAWGTAWAQLAYLLPEQNPPSAINLPEQLP